MFEKFNALVNEPMSAHTTLKLGGPADYMVFPGSEEEIAELYAEARANDVPVTVIGHGSNLLVLDGGIRGLVICIGKNMRQITREGNIIRAQAGAMLGSVAMEAAEAGLQGLEFASGIPGTVGGGVTMNAGAYCGEIVQVVRNVRGIYPDGTRICLTREEMDFGYRHSVVMEKGFIRRYINSCRQFVFLATCSQANMVLRRANTKVVPMLWIGLSNGELFIKNNMVDSLSIKLLPKLQLDL